MLDFNRKPTAKTDEERLFDELNDQYTELFGVPYRFAMCIDMQTTSEAIADIRRRIKDKDPQPEPDYDEGIDY